MSVQEEAGEPGSGEPGDYQMGIGTNPEQEPLNFVPWGTRGESRLVGGGAKRNS